MTKQLHRLARGVLRRSRDVALRPEVVFRAYMKVKYRTKFPPATLPTWDETTGVLHRQRQWVAARERLKIAGLPLHHDGPKNWDTLIALAEVWAATSPDAAVLDAGAELYSAFLPALYACGYRRLVGVNLVFPRVIYRGPIRYEPGDITRTRFADESFHAIACLSVVEHGVDLQSFFAEMSRLLKTGGTLIVSTDYWQDPIDTRGKIAFGMPIHVFTQAELVAAVEIAAEYDLDLIGPLALKCEDRVVRWDAYGLEYTFVTLGFRRAERASSQESFAERSSAAATHLG
ncbi:MAG: methyltransferase domain-containing protein [Pirellulales bacterium]|nr:methyltransferase domain-containing protein [Pirellulales bacterium]